MPSFTIPPLTNRYILMLIGYGLIILLWLTPEDSTIWVVCVLGSIFAYLLKWLILRGQWGGKTLSPKIWLPVGVGLGLLGGLGSVFMTTVLMLMKNVQHGHANLDFPSEVITGIWVLAPIWMLAGLLVNLGIVLMFLVFYQSPEKNEVDHVLGDEWLAYAED